ncbi:MAG: DNA-binding response regulator [Caldimonas sp.]
MQPSCTSVLVSHRVMLVRAGLVAALSSAPHLRVRIGIGEAASSTCAACDVRVTDPASALELLTRAPRSQSAEAVPLLIVVHEEARQVLGQAWRLGARSYASLATPGATLIEAVDAVGRGVAFRCPSVGLASGCEGDDGTPPSVLPRGGLAPTALRRVRTHIDEHLAEPLALDSLAALTQVSASHFARAFRQSVGMAPHRYINLRRIEAASARIRASDTPLAEIARGTGFVDQSHFTRVFAAHCGETPSAFRRRHR